MYPTPTQAAPRLDVRSRHVEGCQHRPTIVVIITCANRGCSQWELLRDPSDTCT